MKFSIKYFFSKLDQFRNFLRIWSDLLKKSLMENFIFCVVFISHSEQVTVVKKRNAQTVFKLTLKTQKNHAIDIVVLQIF